MFDNAVAIEHKGEVIKMEKYEKPVMEVELFDDSEIETEDIIRSGGETSSIFSDKKPC